jgi:hypothetical protein
MVFFELNSPGEIENEFESFERELAAAQLNVVISHKDNRNGNLFIAINTLIKAEDEFAINLAEKYFGPISASSPSIGTSVNI